MKIPVRRGISIGAAGLSQPLRLTFPPAMRVGQNPAGRIFNLLAGVGLLGYGSYLGFIFNGGTYVLFFQVFVLPVLLVINSLRSAARRRASAIPQLSVPNTSANPGQPG